MKKALLTLALALSAPVQAVVVVPARPAVVVPARPAATAPRPAPSTAVRSAEPAAYTPAPTLIPPVVAPARSERCDDRVQKACNR